MIVFSKNKQTIFEFMQDDVVQTVVHDLKTPMTVIKGYVQMLLSGVMGEMTQEQSQLLQRSVGPLEDLILMTDNLLQTISLQKKDLQLHLEDTDLDQLLTETVDFYEPLFQQRRIQIVRRSSQVMGMRLRLDAFWMKRVLNNLIWNAFKYSKDGGRMRVEVQLQGGCIEISIEDSGSGIPPEQLDRIFDKFSQANPLQDHQLGKGLGLWICKRVMELHEGRISVTSTPGKGSRFSLWLPPTCIA